MAELILSPQANEDLDDIWAYIAEDHLVNADRFIDKLYDKSILLAENPQIGVERPELIIGLRSFPVNHYVLFYQIRPNGIEMIRILRASRDLNQIF